MPISHSKGRPALRHGQREGSSLAIVQGRSAKEGRRRKVATDPGKRTTESGDASLSDGHQGATAPKGASKKEGERVKWR